MTRMNTDEGWVDGPTVCRMVGVDRNRTARGATRQYGLTVLICRMDHFAELVRTQLCSMPG
jgi:hypothetical protein